MSVCVALVMQRAKRMRRIILSSVASSFVQYFFFTLCCERHDFRGEGGGANIEREMCLDFFYNFCQKCFSF